VGQESNSKGKEKEHAASPSIWAIESYINIPPLKNPYLRSIEAIANSKRRSPRNKLINKPDRMENVSLPHI